MVSVRYYCRAQVGNERIWGYYEALTPDLALSCFLQDKAVPDPESSRAWADTVDMVHMSRLLGFMDPFFDPWKCKVPITLPYIEERATKGLKKGHGMVSNDQTHGTASRVWHAERVIWLMNNPESLEDPISMDNECSGGHILCSPVIVDGWHRFFAHRILGRKKIPVLYSGRVDLKNYLIGKRRTPPKDA